MERQRVGAGSSAQLHSKQLSSSGVSGALKQGAPAGRPSSTSSVAAVGAGRQRLLVPLVQLDVGGERRAVHALVLPERGAVEGVALEVV